jgi:molecular chaperone GrpE (heat shock protein)
MEKEKLKNKLIGFQREIVSLTQSLSEKKRLIEEKEDQYCLELISIIDSFENIFNNLASNETDLDKTSKRVIKSCRAVYRKTSRMLEKKGINKIEFPTNKAQPGLCKIIETQSNTELEEGTIIAIVKNGYQKGKSVLRAAEVITISNRQ